jgi:hypothetical protein
MSLHPDGFKCHACGVQGDVFTLWALAYQRATDGEAFKRTVLELADHCGLQLKNYSRDDTSVDVTQPVPPSASRTRLPVVSDVSSTRPQTTEPPPVRREVFARIWDEVRPRPLTDAARQWLTSRAIRPAVAHAYGCRDWHPAIESIRTILRNYDGDALRTAGLLNTEGQAWWPLRTYTDPDRDPQRGLAVPVWHPDHPEAPIGIRWRVYSPGDADNFPPKCFAQPTPGFEEPPLGLCEPAPAAQITLGTSWLTAHVDLDGARAWQEDTTARRLGDYPGPYAVVLCEGETDWLSVASTAVELEDTMRIVPVGLTAMAAEWRDAWTDGLTEAERVVLAFDRGHEGADPSGRPTGEARTGDILQALTRRRDKHHVLKRVVVELRDDHNDLNDLRQRGHLTDRLHRWLHPEDP